MATKADGKSLLPAAKSYIRIHYLDKLKKRRDLYVVAHSKLFSRRFYLQTYPEVAQMRISAAEHYLKFGWKENKDPSPYFSTSKYLEYSQDVMLKGINPLVHYERNGKFEGRKYPIETIGAYRKNSFSRGIKRSVAKLIFHASIKKNQNTRILVILHLFYMWSWQEIREYLANLECYAYDLIVTYTDVTAKKEVLQDILNFKPDAVLQKHPNAGFDVAPFIFALNTVDLSKYDVVFKLQSKGVKRKRIYIYGQFFKRRDWFLNLFEGCIGAFTVHKTIEMFSCNPNIGIVAAKNLIVDDPKHKKNMTLQRMHALGLQEPTTYRYVAGTCFAAKACLLEPIKRLGLSASDFMQNSRGFSLAHRMERIICLVALQDGYIAVGNSVLSLRRFIHSLSLHAWMRKRYSATKVLHDLQDRLDDEFFWFSLENRLIKKCEIVNLPIKNIKRKWLDNIIPIKECAPYRYLVTGDAAVYEEYAAVNEKRFENVPQMSIDRFNQLIKSISRSDFDGTSKLIVVNEDNVIMDGQHRCCYLLYKYGENYQVPVLRIYEVQAVRLKSEMKAFMQRHLPKSIFDRLLHAVKR